MKKLIILLLLPVFFIAKEGKIGFVDSQRIFKEYQATIAANTELQNVIKTYRDSATVLKQNIEQLKSELEAQKLMLSEEARLRKLDEIETLNKNYQNFLKEIFGEGGKIEQKNNELMAPLVKKINDAVAKVSEQEGFSMVLDLSQDIFYAKSELDLTDLVINELNLEYGPETPISGETKKVIALFPFREENTEAADADLGEKCQDELYKIISSFTQTYRIINKSEVRQEIIRRGYGTNIDDNQAYSIGHHFLCHYIVVGKVSKFGTRIDYTIALKDINKNMEIDKKSTSITEEIKLSEELNNDLRALIEKIQQ